MGDHTDFDGSNFNSKQHFLKDGETTEIGGVDAGWEITAMFEDIYRFKRKLGKQETDRRVVSIYIELQLHHSILVPEPSISAVVDPRVQDPSVQDRDDFCSALDVGIAAASKPDLKHISSV